MKNFYEYTIVEVGLSKDGTKSRSLDEVKRSPGFPDSALLHPGYVTSQRNGVTEYWSIGVSGSQHSVTPSLQLFAFDPQLFLRFEQQSHIRDL